MSKPLQAVELLLDSNRGIYIPQHFVEECDIGKWNVKPEDATALAKGPEEEWYWETWETVLNNAEYTAENGDKYVLHQDGDLFAVCLDKMSEDEKESLFGI